MSDQINVDGSRPGQLVLASSAAPFLVRSEVVVVQMVADESAMAAFVSECAAHGTFRLYLLLENIRGSHDATVLQAYLRIASQTGAPEADETYLASIGLFGLRRASSSDGMQFYADITAHAALLRSAPIHADGRIVVSIRPHHAPPQGAPISIGRMRICLEIYKQ
ncbi:MAG TPA: hypothetical protein VF169_10965 [Albitalea sp.]|uniref:DUF7868 domain-containing protein n=1 Tax=Piscinibacter sp. TaxID=1903157 RepID=UPI002ED36341